MNTDIAEQAKRYYNSTPLDQIQTGHRIEFNIGQTVYLKTDNEQHSRIVTGIFLRPNNSVSYCIAFETNETYHYGIEISDERDIVKATSN